LRVSFLVTLIACLLFCGFLQGCESATSRSSESRNNPGAGPKLEDTFQDPDWEVSLKARISEGSRYSIQCGTTSSCWLWTSGSVFTYRQDGQLKELGLEIKEGELLLDLFLLSEDVGWVVTSEGLYRTNNGGNRWERIPVTQLDGGNGRIRAVYFRDDQTGWIAGGKYQEPLKHESLPNNALSDDRKRVLIGCVLMTSDGGVNWREMEVERSIGRFDEIMFAGGFGVVLGDAGMQTIANGEDRWAQSLSEFRNKDTRESPEVLSGFVLDDRRGWVSLSGGKLIRTNDGGKSWTANYPTKDLEVGSEDLVLSNLEFVDDERGLARTKLFGSGKLYKTNDGGRSWSQIFSRSSFSSLQKVPGTAQVVAVSDNGVYAFSPKSRN